jgi:hypothetical protein
VRSRKGVSRPSVQTERGDGDEVTNVTPPDRFFHLLWRVAVLGLLLPSRGSFHVGNARGLSCSALSGKNTYKLRLASACALEGYRRSTV